MHPNPPFDIACSGSEERLGINAQNFLDCGGSRLAMLRFASATYDVVVIGAGVVGISVAFQLSKLGAERVLVLDRGTIGAGTTSQSSGILRTYYSVKENVELARKSWELGLPTLRSSHESVPHFPQPYIASRIHVARSPSLTILIRARYPDDFAPAPRRYCLFALRGSHAPGTEQARRRKDGGDQEGVMSEFREESLSEPGTRREKMDLPPQEPVRTGPLSEAKLLGRRTPPAAATTLRPGAQALGGYQSLAGLLSGYALLIVGNGLFQTLIPLRMLHADVSTFVVGLVQSCYYGGFVVGAVCNRRLIDRIGQHRTFVAFSAAVAILALAFNVFESPLAWALIRSLTGFAFMGLYTSIESWLSGTSRNENRGQIFGLYAGLNYLAVGTGQFLLHLGDGPDGRLFSLVAALFAAAVMPVSLFEGWPVRVADESLDRLPVHSWRNSLRSMAHATPLAIPGCILAGFLYSTFYSMTPVFLARTGFSTSELSTFMGVALIGALIPQWPMGRLSDRIDRRRLVYTTAQISAGLSLVLVVFHVPAVVWVAMLAFVAVTFTQYGLIVSHVNDRTEAHLRVAVSATLLLLFSIGGLIGPAIASLLMTVIGPGGLFVFNALSSLLMMLSAKRALRAIR